MRLWIKSHFVIFFRESFKKLGFELGNLLESVEVPPKHIKILRKPDSVRNGSNFVEEEIELITLAGRELKHRLDKILGSESIHIRAVYEKGKVCIAQLLFICSCISYVELILLFCTGTFEFIRYLLRTAS